MNQIDIKIKEVSKAEFKNLQSSHLTLEISGKTVNHTLINTLRRLAYDYVPTYSFHSDLITIDKNVSIFDNDYMRLRLSEITVPNIKCDVDYLDDKYWRQVDFANPEREKHPNDKKVLELYINVLNDTKEIMNVTTEHAKVFENGVELKNKFDPKFPSLIIQLRPGGTFSCRCVAALGVGKVNHVFCAAGNGYFDDVEGKENTYQLTLESQGQFSEKEIIRKSCVVMKEKLLNTKKLLKEKYDSPLVKDTNAIKIELVNEDHTLGSILNEYLQDHKDVVFSGVSKPNLLIDNMIITLQTTKKNPLVPVMETIDYIIKIFDKIEKF